MRCTFPRTVGFQADGKSLSWSRRTDSKEYSTFQLPCGKCLECRLDYGRQWAVRCVHEAKMYPSNCFITLTYSQEKLPSAKLVYSDFQKFMKKLRKIQDSPIGVFVTGEYGNDKDEFGNLKEKVIHPIHGDVTKRPHWHAIIFNWSPTDGVLKRTNHRGDQVFSSDVLTKIWGQGTAEYGSVTFHSAGYCARYAAKKLIHGHDGEHEFHPISKKSSKHAIGKKYLEKYWPDIFNHGQIVLMDNNGKTTTSSIPRYYEKWFKENHPTEYALYVTQTKARKIEIAKTKTEARAKEEADANDLRREATRRNGIYKGPVRTAREAQIAILESKFKLLQNNLKL